MMKRKPPNGNHQMLPHYESVYKLKQNIIDFEYARENLMKEDYKMVVKRRFQRIYNMMECKSYMKNEDIPENKEIFVFGFKHSQTDKIDNYVIIGCESDEIYGKKLSNFWSKKVINKKDRKEKFWNNRIIFYDFS